MLDATGQPLAPVTRITLLDFRLLDFCNRNHQVGRAWFLLDGNRLLSIPGLPVILAGERGGRTQELTQLLVDCNWGDNRNLAILDIRRNSHTEDVLVTPV